MSYLIFQEKYFECIGVRYHLDNKEKSDLNILSVFYKLINHRPNVYFLGMCPSGVIIDNIISNGSKLIVCDHHPESCFNFQKICKNIHVSILSLIKSYIDFKKSGCQLTWDMFYPKQKYPVAVLHIGNNEILNFSDDDTKPFIIGYKELKLSISDIMSVERNSDDYNKIIKTGHEKLSLRKYDICLFKKIDNLNLNLFKNIYVSTVTKYTVTKCYSRLFN